MTYWPEVRFRKRKGHNYPVRVISDDDSHYYGPATRFGWFIGLKYVRYNRGNGHVRYYFPDEETRDAFATKIKRARTHFAGSDAGAAVGTAESVL